MTWLMPRPGNCQARDRHRLAPQGVQAFLDMEVAAGKTGPTAGVEGDPLSALMYDDMVGSRAAPFLHDIWERYAINTDAKIRTESE